MFAAPALFLQRWGRGRAEANHGVARNKLLQCLFPPALCTLGPFCVKFAAHPTTSIESATGTDLRDGEGDMPDLCLQPAVACRLMHAIPIDGHTYGRAHSKPEVAREAQGKRQRTHTRELHRAEQGIGNQPSNHAPER